MDWKGCEIVERVPGKVSGQPVIKGTRILADTIVEDFVLGSSVEEIHENYPSLPTDKNPCPYRLCPQQTVDSVKVLLDENLPHKLRAHLAKNETITVAYMGWGGLKNGELLRAAEESDFDVFVTGERVGVSANHGCQENCNHCVVIRGDRWSESRFVFAGELHPRLMPSSPRLEMTSWITSPTVTSRSHTASSLKTQKNSPEVFLRVYLGVSATPR